MTKTFLAMLAAFLLVGCVSNPQYADDGRPGIPIPGTPFKLRSQTAEQQMDWTMQQMLMNQRMQMHQQMMRQAHPRPFSCTHFHNQTVCY
jgi:hypothetical protein